LLPLAVSLAFEKFGYGIGIGPAGGLGGDRQTSGIAAKDLFPDAFPDISREFAKTFPPMNVYLSL
jgi:hypothetical protein